MAEPDYISATRTAYDKVAAAYAEALTDALDANPFDRAVLGLYADLVKSATPAVGGRVAEIGCGSGRVTAYLAKLGLDIFGIDLSPGMLEEARRRHPALEFRLGDMTALELPAGALAGLVAWYSMIHVPPAEHPAVFASFRRALAGGGHLILAFQVGDERRSLTEAYGHSDLSYDAYRLPPDRVEQEAMAAGFLPVARMVREPFGVEKTTQAYLVLRADGAAA